MANYTFHRILVIALLSLIGSLAHGQGYRSDGIVQSRSGFPASGATVAVCAEPATVTTVPCGTLATLFTDNTLTVACAGSNLGPPPSPGGPCSNPMLADSLGNYHFYVAPGRYAVQFSGPTLTTYSERDQIFPCDPGNCAAGNLGNSSFLIVNGTNYATLSAALAACPAAGCYILDIFPETWNTNIFSGFTKEASITFGSGTWTANAQQIIPPNVSYMTGQGRTFGGNTVFKAGSSFPINTPVFKFLGGQGQVFERAVVDCNSISGSTGIFATDWNENAGLSQMLVLNCPVYSVNVDASLFTSEPAQNYFIRDLEAFPGLAGSGTTVGLHLKGNGGGGPDVRDVTISGQTGHTILSSVQAENWNTGIIQNLHGEFATNVFQSLAGNPISFFIMDQVSGSNTDTTVVRLDGATSNGFHIRNLLLNGATNIIVDNARATTLTDSVVTQYSIGTGAIGSQDIYTTSPNVSKVLIGTGTKVTSPVINGTPTGTGLQGTDTKLLTSGPVSGIGSLLCLDANSGATTSSCNTVLGVTKISTGSLGGASCTTGASSFSTCTSVITVTPTQADTSYVPHCDGITPSDPRALIQWSAATSTSTITATVITEGSVAVSFADIKCTAIHP